MMWCTNGGNLQNALRSSLCGPHDLKSLRQNWPLIFRIRSPSASNGSPKSAPKPPASCSFPKRNSRSISVPTLITRSMPKILKASTNFSSARLGSTSSRKLDRSPWPMPAKLPPSSYDRTSRRLFRFVSCSGQSSFRTEQRQARNLCFRHSPVDCSLPFRHLHFQFLERFWPIFSQQARKRPIGQQLPARLARRTIIRLVRSILDPLDCCPASRTRLLVLPMHSHFRTKGRHTLRKLVPRFAPEPLHPFRQ